MDRDVFEVVYSEGEWWWLAYCPVAAVSGLENQRFYYLENLEKDRLLFSFPHRLLLQKSNRLGVPMWMSYLQHLSHSTSVYYSDF